MKKAIGKTSKGNEVEFEVGSNGWVGCQNEDLIELIIPEGFKWVWCEDNQLTELIIPEGCKYVCCYDNQIKTLKLPNSMEWVRSDLGVVNLNDYKNSDTDFRFKVK
jgi:hypothetical protein